MSNEQLQLMGEIDVKISALATLQLSLGTTVNEGLRTPLARSHALLEIVRFER